MKRLTPHTGGMPYTIDHLAFLQDGLTEGVVLALSHQYDTVILSGIEESTSADGLTNILSAGHIFHQGKIYRFEGGTYGATFPYLVPAEKVIPEGNKMYEDGVTKSTYVEDIVEINATSSPNSIPVSQLENYRFGKKLRGRVTPQNYTGSNIQYRKEGNVVSLSGYCDFKTGLPTVLATLPESIRPTRNLRKQVFGFTDKVFQLQLFQSTGNVEIYCNDPHEDIVTIDISYISV